MSEENRKNYYEVLGIDKSLVDYVLCEKKKSGEYESKLRSEESKDLKIKEAYEACKDELFSKHKEKILGIHKEYELKLGMIEIGIKNNTDLLRKNKLIEEKENIQEELRMKEEKSTEEFNIKLAEIIEAYEMLKTEGARSLYDEQLREIELEKNKERKLLNETAYTFFGISEKEINLRGEAKNNKLINETYERKLEKYNEVLNNKNLNENQKNKIRKLIIKTKQYYNLISNKEKREKYKKKLDLKEETEKRKLREQLLKEKYSKIEQLDLDMIGTVTSGKNKGKKLVVKKENKDFQVIDLNDSRKIKISKIGEIIFKDSALLCNSVNEYLISRIVNGKEKTDKIYTNLSLTSLSEDNLDYYNCVVNEMLSEDVIEAVTKYNGGYIGMIEKDEVSGGYKATIKDKSLNIDEQEIFAAVMINLENEKNKEDKKQEDGNLEL